MIVLWILIPKSSTIHTLKSVWFICSLEITKQNIPGLNVECYGSFHIYYLNTSFYISIYIDRIPVQLINMHKMFWIQKLRTHTKTYHLNEQRQRRETKMWVVSHRFVAPLIEQQFQRMQKLIFFFFLSRTLNDTNE